MNDHDEYSGHPEVPDELIEALKERLAEEDGAVYSDATPSDAVDEPTDPEVYAETDPSEDVANIQPGDPGTYSGEYAPAESADAEVAERDDLPEGYIPGSYTGPYLPKKDDRASN